jgi:hypothetical protein
MTQRAIAATSGQAIPAGQSCESHATDSRVKAAGEGSDMEQ